MRESDIKRMVRRCMNVLKKKEYELDLRKFDVDRAVNKTRVVSKPNRTASYYDPNWFVIQINLNPWPNCDRSHYKPEYKSYDKDPVIGGRQIETLEQSLWLTVAHEVSHYVQYRHCPRIKRFRGKYQKSHGDCFKQIYRYLRRDFINPMLDG